MTSDFWTYENREQNARRKAQQWLLQARQAGLNYSAKNQAVQYGIDPNVLTLPPTAFDNRGDSTGLQELTPKPESSGDGGFLSKIGLNDIDQPWDVLRPVARLFEAEQRYLSGPLAKAIYNDGIQEAVRLGSFGTINPPEYEDLPEPVKFAAENLLSPSTWIAPGALIRAGRFLPKLATGLPSLGGMAVSKGSRTGLMALLEEKVVRASIPGTAAAAIAAPFGMEAARELGVPPILGAATVGLGAYSVGARIKSTPRVDFKPGDKAMIVNPDDMRVYHGTSSDLNDIPDPSRSGRNFITSVPGVIYASDRPDTAGFFADVFWSQTNSNAGSRIIPMVLKKGVKYWDPNNDFWPAGFDDIKANFVAQRATGNALEGFPFLDGIMEQEIRRGGGGWSTESQAFKLGQKRQLSFVDALKKRGFQAMKAGQEVAIFDTNALRPLYDASEIHSLIGGGRNAEQDFNSLRKEIEKARKALKLSEALRSDDEALAQAFAKPDYEALDRQLSQDLEDSIDAVGLLKKFRAGAADESDILRAQELLARRAARTTSRSGPKSSLLGENDYSKATGDTREQISALDSAYQGAIPLKRGGPIHDLFVNKNGQLDVSLVTEYQKNINDAIRRGLSKQSTRDLYDSLRENRELQDFLESDLKNAVPGEDITYRKELGQAQRAEQSFIDELRNRGEFSLKGGSEDPEGIINILQALNNLPDSMMQARSVTDVLAEMDGARSLTQSARALLRDTPLNDIIEKKGIRLFDDDAALVIREYRRMRSIGAHQAGATADIIAEARKRLQPALTRLGVDEYELFRNLDEYTPVRKSITARSGGLLTDEELKLIEVIHAPVRNAIETARAFGVENVPDARTPRGYFVSIQPTTETPVRERLFARQPQTRPETVISTAAAGEQGVAIRDFGDAQQAFVASMMKASSDSWLKAAIAPYSASLSDLVPAELLSKQKYLQSEISKLYPQSRGNSPAAVQVRQMRDLLKAEKTQVDDEIRQARSGIERQAGQQGGVNGMVRGAGGKLYPEGVQKQLRELEPRNGDDLITIFNNNTRPLMATLDASFLGIQGLIGLARNPVAYLRAVTTAFSGEAYDTLIRKYADSGLLDDFIKHDGVWLTRNDMGEFLFPHWVQGVPVVGPASQTANTWFTRFGNAQRLLLYESQLPLALDDAAKRALARNVSLSTGYSPNPATRAETIAMFAPRFFRSQLGLIADSLGTRGVHPLARDEARKMLRNLVIGGAAVTYATNQLLGNETDFDPTSSNFMRIRVAGQDVSVFGPWDTLVRAASNSFRDGFDPTKGAAYLVRAKSSPALARVFDLMTGETFQGDTLDWSSTSSILTSMWSEAQQLTPISGQSAIERIRAGGPLTEVLAGAAVEFGGTKASPITASERRDLISLDVFNKRWKDLEPYQRSQLERQYPNAAVIQRKGQDAEALDNRRAISIRFADRQAALDEQFPAGPDWVEAYQDLRREQTGAFEQWETEHPDVANKLADRLASQTIDNPNEIALESYYGLFKSARAENWTPEEITRALDSLETSWSSEQASYVKRNTGLRDTPQVKEYKKAQEVLAPYWDIEDEVWNRIADRPIFRQYSSLDQYVQVQAENLRRQGVPEGLVSYRIERLPIVRQFQSTVRQLRLQYRRAHPDVDAELVKWYGAVPIRLQR